MSTVLSEWLDNGERGKYTKAVVKADLLNRAADLIVVNGWARNAFINSDGCMCIEGALAAAADFALIEEDDFHDDSNFKLDLVEECIVDIIQHLGLEGDSRPYRLLTDWNDEPGRDLTEVEAALRGTAGVVAA